MKLFYQAILFLSLSSCASLEREKYFKAQGISKSLTNHSASRFPDSEVKISESLQMKVFNSTLITYLGGLFIPVLPVYFFPDMRRDIPKEEMLTIIFYTNYFGPLKKDFEKIDFIPPVIQLSSGELIRATKSEFVEGYAIKFIYPVKALATEKFTVNPSTIIMTDRKKIISPKVEFQFDNSLNYKCCENAN